VLFPDQYQPPTRSSREVRAERTPRSTRGITL